MSNRMRGVTRRVATNALIAASALSGFGGVGIWSASVQGCQTPLLVFTDPANPGATSQSGDIAVTRDSGLLGG